MYGSRSNRTEVTESMARMANYTCLIQLPNSGVLVSKVWSGGLVKELPHLGFFFLIEVNVEKTDQTLLSVQVQYKEATNTSKEWNTLTQEIPPHIHSYEVDGLTPDKYYR